MPLDALVLGVDRGAVRRALLRTLPSDSTIGEAQRRALGPSVDALAARVAYDFQREVVQLEGIVDLFTQVTPSSFTRAACLAFPRGGESDVRDCRYGR
jgi:hypothetical protein